MKAAIVTLQSINYGNRLQNYALQQVLTELGCEVESLRRAPFGPSHKLKRIVRDAIKNDRLTAFHGFDADNIALSPLSLSQEGVLQSLVSAYDVFVIGSDQVWNPNFPFNSELDYLPMVSSKKKLAYAASFGVNHIEQNQGRTAELLNGIPRISVRERAGADIVANLTGRDVPVVLDPTMLLTTDDWAAVAARPKAFNCDGAFALKCILGDDANAEKIAAMVAKRGLQLVDVMEEPLKIGPAEFVWLVANSSLVCTDSFHASVFALLHHKPLAAFERVGADADMSSRFDTLCALFALEGHRSSEATFGLDASFDTNWEDFELRLAELRAFSRRWLDGSLGAVAHA